jgi:hypothetical protein
MSGIKNALPECTVKAGVGMLVLEISVETEDHYWPEVCVYQPPGVNILHPVVWHREICTHSRKSTPLIY